MHWQQGPVIHFRARISGIHLVFCGKSHIETDPTGCGKKLTEPVNALAMTSSELELELKPPELELELELIFKRLAGFGVGVQTPGVGVGIGVETLGSWSLNWS